MKDVFQCSLSHLVDANVFKNFHFHVADPGRRGKGAMSPTPHGFVKISDKQDSRRMRPHRFHVSWSLPYLAAGSATGQIVSNVGFLFRL